MGRSVLPAFERLRPIYDLFAAAAASPSATAKPELATATRK
jgi:hypothetical protein